MKQWDGAPHGQADSRSVGSIDGSCGSPVRGQLPQVHTAAGGRTEANAACGHGPRTCQAGPGG